MSDLISLILNVFQLLLQIYENAIRELALSPLMRLFFLGLFVLPGRLRRDWPQEEDWKGGSGTSLLLVSVFGMVLLASNHSGMQLFIGFEMILAGMVGLLHGSVVFEERKKEHIEAAIKLFLSGQVMAGMLLLAISLPNGLGSVLAILSFSFLAGIVPMHYTQPDLAQAAPRGLGAFLIVGSKTAAILALFHFWADHPGRPDIERTLSLIAWLSTLLGGLAAANQRNIRRMLGYGSICQSGLILGSLSNAHGLGDSDLVAVEIALVAYGMALFVAFQVLDLTEKPLGGQEAHRLAGLWKRNPLLATALGLALLSLTGLPPTLGMLGNWAVWQETWQHYRAAPLEGVGMMAGMAIGQLTLLYGFLTIFKNLFWSAPRQDGPLLISPHDQLWLKFLMALLVGGGLWQGWTILARVSH